MGNTAEKKNFMDIFVDKIMIIAEPMGRLSSIPIMKAIQSGFSANMSLILVGSIFLIIGSLANGNLGLPPIAFLAPHVAKFTLINKMTMGFLALYVAIAMAIAYAKEKDVSEISAALLGCCVFFVINFNEEDLAEGVIDINRFGASSVFISMVVILVAIKIFSYFIERKLTIKLPDAVPANIANAFISLIPYLAVVSLAWLVRTVMNIDLVTVVNAVLNPILQSVDNIGFYTLDRTLSGVFWSAGLHYENMTSGIVRPFTTQWLAENAAAMEAGVALTDLPHIYTQGVNIWSNRPCFAYPILLLALFSKAPGMKAVGRACLIPVMFCICEPLMFGLPVVMNPFLIIPYILTCCMGSVVTYTAMSLKLVNRCFASSPWAAPCSLSALIQTGGDWRALVLIVINFAIGCIIYYPFWKAFEKSLIKKEAKTAEQS